MTTAARPTWDTAKGGSGKGERDLSALSKQYSSRDLPAHTKIKYRQEGQGTTEELRGRDFRRELENWERTAREKRDKHRDSSSSSSSSSKRPRLEQIPAANLDADDPVDDDEEEEEDSDDEDDTAELLAELQKIKKERASEKAKMDAEKKVEEERIRTENILKGNPLLGQAGAGPEKTDFKVKRREQAPGHQTFLQCVAKLAENISDKRIIGWDDDVVFKNCAKGEEARKVRHFINDTLRSEFHKKFMEKYVK